MQSKFSLILSDTTRSIEYIKFLHKEKIKPEYSIILNKKKNNIHLKKKIINKFLGETKVITFKTDIITQKIRKFIFKKKINIFLFSGKPGYIIKDKDLLNRVKFLHAHPGKLPEFKGSTTIYYTLLRKKKIYCTTFILTHKLDSGKKLLSKEFRLPKNINDIDHKYDNFIRANTLISTIRNFNSLYKRTVPFKNEGDTYHIIHPVLRSLTLQRFKS